MFSYGNQGLGRVDVVVDAVEFRSEGRWRSGLCDCADSILNPFSASQLSTTNFSLYNTYKIGHLVMRKWELIKQSQLLKIKSQILSNLFNEKYGLRLEEFKNTTGTERVNWRFGTAVLRRSELHNCVEINTIEKWL